MIIAGIKISTITVFKRLWTFDNNFKSKAVDDYITNNDDITLEEFTFFVEALTEEYKSPDRNRDLTDSQRRELNCYDLMGDLIDCEWRDYKYPSENPEIKLDLFRFTHDIDQEESFAVGIRIFQSGIFDSKEQENSRQMTTTSLIAKIRQAEEKLRLSGFDTVQIYSIQDDCRCCS